MSLIVVFILDLSIPLGVAVGVLYLCCFAFILRESRNTILIFTGVAFILVVLNTVLYYSADTDGWVVLLNRAISVIAIIITSIITLRYQQQENDKGKLKDLLDAYINAIDQNIISSVTDSNGKILVANNKFCEISKYSKNELEGEMEQANQKKGIGIMNLKHRIEMIGGFIKINSGINMGTEHLIEVKNVELLDAV